MDAVLDALGALHLLRPWWLLAVPLIGLLWWRVRKRTDAGETAPDGIAPHLAEALTVGDGDARRVEVIDLVCLALLLLALAASGSTWSRVPNPLLAQTAPLVVALEVSPSMEAPDLPPYRLERAKFKILDLVDRRAGARTALIAYGSTAHRVAPLTEDPNILRAMLEALSTEVMPGEGDNATAALELARAELAKSETPGAILFVLDELNAADAAAFAPQGEGDAPVIFLVAAPAGSPTGALDQVAGAEVIQLSADDSDIDRIEAAAASAYRAALLGDERLDWDDRGWMLGWLAMPLVLIWFRRGWSVRWALAFALAAGLHPSAARADVIDWFFTPDQQGMMAYRGKDFRAAGEVFLDPMWRALSMFRAGQYPEAADVYSRLDTAAAAFGEGMARTRNREYRPAIAAYERALELQPDFPEAAWNLEVTKAILDYVEATREAGDTGEQGGIGADDVVFDNEAARGEETVKEYSEKDDVPAFTTADQWMRSVDTDMGDFLRTRFLQESAGGSE
ncbi:Ca-activated chloride channel family protein [Aliiruegeria haliotis]|uniref:Ca-activated chloride channel family protein n=1 Tax=Aliiruegeria haliotis TaxID=1280846 RepID=A0A2T0S038_9RHOB|nr:VWA domain-containing protein [Aliiruegeria haliotis]PRY26801.1 Ca-activated chloride channel family protein [Aliiruegeria haliotis]